MTTKDTQQTKVEIIVQPNYKKIDEFTKRGVSKENKIELQTKKILEETGKVVPVDKFTLDRTKGYLKRIKDHIKAIELTRKTIKDPVLKLGESIDTQSKIYKKELEEKAAEFTREINDFKASEEKRIADENKRVDTLCGELTKCKTEEELQIKLKSYESIDRYKKPIVKSYKATLEKIQEEVRVQKLREEEAEMKRKKSEQIAKEIEKIGNIKSIQELGFFGDYLENVYGDFIPEEIQEKMEKTQKSLLDAAEEEGQQKEEKSLQVEEDVNEEEDLTFGMVGETEDEILIGPIEEKEEKTKAYIIGGGKTKKIDVKVKRGTWNPDFDDDGERIEKNPEDYDLLLSIKKHFLVSEKTLKSLGDGNFDILCEQKSSNDEGSILEIHAICGDSIEEIQRIYTKLFDNQLPF